MSRFACLFALVSCFAATACSTPSVPEDSETGQHDVVAAPKTCVRAGCSGEFCLDAKAENPPSDCSWLPEYACYQQAACEVQSDGECAFTETKELTTCVDDARKEEPTQPEKPCFKTGCSGEICADEDVATTCVWDESFACYQKAVCARQADGACGFTGSSELSECLADAAGK